MTIVVRKIPDIAIQVIAAEEGLILHKYIDFAGYPTICVGHLIRKGETFPDEMTTEACQDLLHKDLLNTAVSIMRLVTVPISDNQYASLLSWTFNVGTGALQASTLRSRLNRGEYDGVPEEMRRWIWAGGKKSKILIGRREREIILWQTEDSNEEESITEQNN